MTVTTDISSDVTKTGDTVTADFHFGELARFYPAFKNLKSLLFAIDLRGMVNFKL